MKRCTPNRLVGSLEATYFLRNLDPYDRLRLQNSARVLTALSSLKTDSATDLEAGWDRRLVSLLGCESLFKVSRVLIGPLCAPRVSVLVFPKRGFKFRDKVILLSEIYSFPFILVVDSKFWFRLRQSSKPKIF